jgi:hypothetical protein
MKLLLCAAATAAIVGFATASLATPAVTLTSDGEYYSGAPYTLGFSFTVTGNQTITALGAFDQNSDGLAGAADVGLWDANGDLLASAVVPSGTGGTLDGEFRYTAITPFALTAGTTYFVGAYEPDDNASSLNTGQGGSGFVNGNVTIIQDQFAYNGTFEFPSVTDEYPGGAWLGANFELGSVPEPSTWALLGLGVFGLGFALRRAKGAATAAA